MALLSSLTGWQIGDIACLIFNILYKLVIVHLLPQFSSNFLSAVGFNFGEKKNSVWEKMVTCTQLLHRESLFSEHKDSKSLDAAPKVFSLFIFI